MFSPGGLTLPAAHPLATAVIETIEQPGNNQPVEWKTAQRESDEFSIDLLATDDSLVTIFDDTQTIEDNYEPLTIARVAAI